MVWLPTAQNELTDKWLHAADRKAVTQAAHEVDQELRVDAETKGVDFYGDRLLVAGPLQVIYRVQVDDRLVTVLQVL